VEDHRLKIRHLAQKAMYRELQRVVMAVDDEDGVCFGTTPTARRCGCVRLAYGRRLREEGDPLLNGLEPPKLFLDVPMEVVHLLGEAAYAAYRHDPVVRVLVCDLRGCEATLQKLVVVVVPRLVVAPGGDVLRFGDDRVHPFEQLATAPDSFVDFRGELIARDIQVGRSGIGLRLRRSAAPRHASSLPPTVIDGVTPCVRGRGARPALYVRTSSPSVSCL
jgi:hypothetical protein